jgi:hypothetical protein
MLFNSILNDKNYLVLKESPFRNFYYIQRILNKITIFYLLIVSNSKKKIVNMSPIFHTLYIEICPKKRDKRNCMGSIYNRRPPFLAQIWDKAPQADPLVG